jgi:hypothetical protein
LAQGTTRGVPIDTDPLLSADSDLLVPSQKAVKAYADTKGDMKLAFVQTNLGAKTFLDTTFLLRNVANTFNASFTNTNTADRIYTLPDTAGTIALTSNLTGYVPYTGATANVDLGANNLFANRIGIGTSNPLYQLHIVKTGASTVPVAIRQNDVSFGTMIRYIGANGNTYGEFGITSGSTPNTYSGDMGGMNYLLMAGGVERMRMFGSGGNVSIGTTSDLARLAVQGASASTGSAVVFRNSTPTTLFEQFNNGEAEFRGGGSVSIFKGLKIGNTGATSIGLLISDSSTSGSGPGFGANIWMNGNGRIFAGNSGSGFYNSASSDVAFGRHAANTWGIYQGQISTTLGNLALDTLLATKVGIGTTTPSQALHLVGNMLAQTTLSDNTVKEFYLTTQSYTNSVGFINTLTSVINLSQNILYLGGIGSLGYTNIRFHTSSNNTTNSVEAMRIIENGNVSIGTTNPTQKLYADGDIGLKAANYLNLAGDQGSSRTTGFQASFATYDKIVVLTNNQAIGTFSRDNGWGIGFSTTPSARLHVRGDSASTGTAFLVQNSTPTNIFKIDNDQNIYHSSLGVAIITSDGRFRTWRIETGIGEQGLSLIGRVMVSGDNVTAATIWTNSNPTSGTINGLHVSTGNAIWQPTSGNANFTSLRVSGIINQTGTANGTVRGIYYNPTLTSVLGTHNAWESTSGRIIATDTSISPYSFATTYAGAANSNNGAFYIVSNGNLNNLMLTSNSGTYATTNYAGMGFLVTHSTLGAALTVRVRSRYYDTTNATLEFSTNRGAVNPTFAGKFHGDMFAVGDFEYSVPTATIHGKGNSASTGNVFLLQNATPTSLFTVANNGNLSFGNITGGGFSYTWSTGETRFDRGYTVWVQDGVNPTVTIRGANWLGHASNLAALSVAGSYSPTSGSWQRNSIQITTTINQTGTADGITRGMYILPTLTSAADYRAIEAISRNNANDTLLKLSNNSRDVLCVKGDNKIGLYNAVPTIQGTTAMAAATYTNNGSIDLDTFDGYTIGQAITQLRNMGILS